MNDYNFSETIKFDKQSGKWILGKRYEMGYYNSLEDAQDAEAAFERTLGTAFLDSIESFISSTDKNSLSDLAVIRVNAALER
jgi:hypothetical protein